MDERQIRGARYVLVIASPRYRALAEGEDVPGRGVPWEARQLQELLYRNFSEGLRTILPVVLPGNSTADIPDWLLPTAATSYEITELTSDGIDRLMRVLTDQPLEQERPIRPVKVRQPRPAAVAASRSSVNIRAELAGGKLSSSVRLDGVLLCERAVPLDPEVVRAWDALPIAAVPAGERLLRAGRRLAEAIFDDTAMRTVADRVAQLPPGDWLDVVVTGDGAALRLPVELLRLTAGDGTDLGPLGLVGGVGVRRRVGGAATQTSAPLPGPLKILAAVAAPDETRTTNAPLDVEAEMQAVLDAVGGVASDQVRILEVASLDQRSSWRTRTATPWR